MGSFFGRRKRGAQEPASGLVRTRRKRRHAAVASTWRPALDTTVGDLQGQTPRDRRRILERLGWYAEGSPKPCQGTAAAVVVGAGLEVRFPTHRPRCPGSAVGAFGGSEERADGCRLRLPWPAPMCRTRRRRPTPLRARPAPRRARPTSAEALDRRWTATPPPAPNVDVPKANSNSPDGAHAPGEIGTAVQGAAAGAELPDRAAMDNARCCCRRSLLAVFRVPGLRRSRCGAAIPAPRLQRIRMCGLRSFAGYSRGSSCSTSAAKKLAATGSISSLKS